ncbi:MAG: MFS transporter [Frankiaceae bacterium]|nr:MFS transporter [Frankiaceae bacterium]
MTATQPELDPQPIRGAKRPFPRGREFRLLFAGQSVSSIGDRLVMVAMPFAVLTIPGAGLSDVGLVLGSSALTLALFVLIGGVWADRLPRQLTMLASDIVRAIAQAGTATLLITDHAHVWHLIVLQMLYGAAEAFFRPAALGLVPQVVEREEIQSANALMGLSMNVGMVAGPAAAGILVAWAGAGVALAVDAGSFVVSAAALALLKPRPVVRTEDRTSFLSELAGGWREVTSRTWVWSLILSFTAYHFLVLPSLFVLGPAVAESDRGGAAAWGIISTGFGIGAVLGSLLALRWRPSRPGLVVAGALCIGATQCTIVVSPLSTIVVALLEALTGVGVAICFTIWETALQERIPEAAQSRVSSFDYLGSLTLMPLGYLVVGPAAHLLGTKGAALAATVITLAVALAVALGRDVRRLSRQ